MVLGGLIQDQETPNISGIAYLRKFHIPASFSLSLTKSRDWNELLIFIQPTVVSNDLDAFWASLKEKHGTVVRSQTAPLAHPSDCAEPALPLQAQKIWQQHSFSSQVWEGNCDPELTGIGRVIHYRNRQQSSPSHAKAMNSLQFSSPGQVERQSNSCQRPFFTCGGKDIAAKNRETR